MPYRQKTNDDRWAEEVAGRLPMPEETGLQYIRVYLSLAGQDHTDGQAIALQRLWLLRGMVAAQEALVRS